MASDEQQQPLVVDPFCYRQFQECDASANYAGTVFSTSISEFAKIANSRFDPNTLKDGYAPFCKHIFIKNDFTDARVNVLPITPENESLLRTRYESRNEKELPVLSRHFPRDAITTPLPVAKYLDLILYSREQIRKENAATGRDSDSDAPWGIISIKAQDVDFELPMQPITVMRNALGVEEGGSGISLNRANYMASHDYWKDHAVIL
eukprot:CAMPEP_0172482490 /NCGR_PEP_ID=MMETSP1066-20121228/8911_1 /TAXON_ID=671091 /ORGANISM="Coscinodiscus wailesii, Strain CCMP2513" /LENGTH=206 /DNA_ID=CAMNT_0013245633 /DNA_START=219 /DNA_END=839 /DNA_ORIENTATION=+